MKFPGLRRAAHRKSAATASPSDPASSQQVPEASTPEPASPQPAPEAATHEPVTDEPEPHEPFLREPARTELAQQPPTTEIRPYRWEPAAEPNFRPAGRPVSWPIRYVVLEWALKGYDREIERYRDPAQGVSAHYVIRAQDGEVTQMVRDRDIAICPAAPKWLEQSIVIAHERPDGRHGQSASDLLASSASLVSSICDRYGIPKDREHVLDMAEIPGAQGGGLGPAWDWDGYMAFLGIEPGILVDNATPGRFWSSPQWSVSNWNRLRYGPDYRYAAPAPRRDAAWYRIPLPASGRYAVYTWYPSARSHNASTPVVLFTSEGMQEVRVDQSVGGGRWVPLGIFPFTAGDHWSVAVSRWTDTPGHVVADAFRFVAHP